MTEISLSLEYQQAKRNYKASKTSANADNKENAANPSAAEKIRPKVWKSKNPPSKSPKDLSAIPSVSNRVPSKAAATYLPRRSSSAAVSSKSKNNDDVPPPSKEKGLELLGLIRPSDSRAEFGLSSAIQTHLTESIKLCGLKSRRETSLIDMVRTLCNHLSNREQEITIWTEFADTVASTTAGKIQESLGKIHEACVSRDDARESTRTCRMALQSIRTQYASMREAHDTLKQEIIESLSSFPPLITEMKRELELKLGSHTDYLHSESKMDVCDAVEELARVHDNETLQLETTIHSLTQTVQSGKDKMEMLQKQIDICQIDLETEKASHSELQDELHGAQERIQHLEQLVQKERIDKQKELAGMEERMNEELDDIKKRVTESFQALTERKDRDIAAALQRAQNAEKVLEDLKASLV